MAAGSATLSSLLASSAITDHEEILKASNASLRKSKGDVDAQHARVVALLKLDRFQDASRVFDEAGSDLKATAPLEYAYSLYKIGRLEEAVSAAQASLGSTQSPGLLHVLAQATYRSEDFAGASEAYKKLKALFRGSDAEANDLRVNGTAVDAQLERTGAGHLVSNRKPSREDLEAFESAYNTACASIARGELSQSEVLLKRAEDLCQANDELTEADKEAEILPIRTQRVYVLLRTGKLKEAEELSKQVSNHALLDHSTRQIAQINALVSSADSINPFLAGRLIQPSTSEPQTEKLFGYQARALSENTNVLELLAKNYEGLQRATLKVSSNVSGPTLSPEINEAAVLNAAAVSRNGIGKAGVKALLPLLEKRPDDIGLLLTVIQLYVLTNNHSAALSLLEAFFSKLEQSTTPADQDVRFAPGLVAAAVSLHASQNHGAKLRDELAKAVAHWREKSKSSSDSSAAQGAFTLFRAGGAELLSRHNSEDDAVAASLYKELYAISPSDPAAVAGLLAASDTATPTELPQSALDSIPDAQRLTKGIDAAALESAGVASLPTPVSVSRKRTAAADRTRDKKATVPAKKKRKLSAKRTPKDFVEGKTMDPERWLPMKDRTYYRPKGKNKKKAKLGGGGTQGGVVDDDLDGSKVGGGAQAGAGASGGAGPKKKSKKKGGSKW